MKCCQGCTERWIEGTKRCHDTCERYLAEVEKLQARKNTIREARNKTKEGDSYAIKTMKKIRKRCNR